MEEISLRNYAHLGDAVWELFIREITILHAQKTKELHKLTTDKVNAKFQQELLLKLRDFLNEEEFKLTVRGRNLPVPAGRRANQREYRMATAFEVLIGWLYLKNKKRLDELLHQIKEFL